LEINHVSVGGLPPEKWFSLKYGFLNPEALGKGDPISMLVSDGV